MIGPVAVTMWAGSAGRSMPSMRPRRKTAAAMVAPVEPALTTASALPSRTRSVATRIDARRLARRAAAGCSPISIDVGRVDEADAGRPAAPVLGDLALQAGHVTDEDHLVGVRGGVVDRPSDDLTRCVVATHRVDRDAHGAQRPP